MALFQKISTRALPVFLLAYFSWTSVWAQNSTTTNQSAHHYYTTDNGQNPQHFSYAGKDSLGKYSGQHQLKPGVKVIGFHPSWLGGAYRAYNYTLLTHIIYFSFEVDPRTGNYRDLNGWDTTQLPALAKKENPGCQVLLAASCFGEDVVKLLDNIHAQIDLIDNLKIQVMNKKADGVCIDFEGIPAGRGQQFRAFLTNLSSTFKYNKLTVTITLPAIDADKTFEVEGLDQTVDFYILMGYDYFGGFSKTTGPVAPLNTKGDWVTASLSQSVKSYLDRGVKASSLVLALPYYGAIWETTSSKTPGQAKKFLGYRAYNYFNPASLKKFSVDTVVQSLYLSYNTADDQTVYRQCWVDGVSTLSKKYDYILEQELGGVALWALGFDNGTHELWDLLKSKFAVADSSAIKPADNKPVPNAGASTFERISAFVKTYPVAVFICLFMIMSTLFAVLAKTVTDGGSVATLKKKSIYYQLLICLFVVLGAIIFVLLYYGFGLTFNAALVATGTLLALLPFMKDIHFFRKKDQP